MPSQKIFNKKENLTLPQEQIKQPNIIEKPRSMEAEPHQRENTEKQVQTEKRQPDISTFGVAGTYARIQENEQHQKAIEDILARDIEEIYEKLPPAEQQKFKIAGEKAAKDINNLLSRATVQVKKILSIIKNWLLMIPAVNKFFLEQSAKIKTDELIKLKERW